MIVEGRNPVIEALKSGSEIESILIANGSKEASITKIVAMAKEQKVIVKNVDRRKLDEMSESKSHQGVIAIVAEYSYFEVEEILQRAKDKGQDPFVVILDGITDPHNLGAIIRTADAAGAHGIIIPKRRSITVNPTVIKTSAGATEYMAVAKVTNITRTIEELQEKGLWIGALDMGETPYYKQNLKGPIGIVIGAEGKGISRLVKEKCDFVLSIPMAGGVSSLNASVAGGILMYEILKQRSV